jgi:hypothetical protein
VLVAFLLVSLVSTTAVPNAGATPACDTVRIHPSTLPDGRVGLSYGAQISATPASADAYAWIALPDPPVPGVAFHPNTPQERMARLDGVPTTPGDFTFDVVATLVFQGVSCTAVATYTVHMEA